MSFHLLLPWKGFCGNRGNFNTTCKFLQCDALNDRNSIGLKIGKGINCSVISNMMSELVDKTYDNMSAEQQISELKLQLNATQQTIASLELKIRQKEEIIIKTQADSNKQVENFKGEIKKLKEQLHDKLKIIENNSTEELQHSLQLADEKNAKLNAQLQEHAKKEQTMSEIMQEFENTIASQAMEHKKLNELHEAVKVNLATLELAFHDVIQKYERAKSVIEGFKANEDVFTKNIETMEKNLKLEAQRYESLKSHAKTQIERANKENSFLKTSYDALELKQNAIIKRLEIKAAALEVSLEQKTKECSDLAALCDEVTGKKV